MALTLNTIFNFTETPYSLKILAGKKALSKTVSWVYYTEDFETVEFIRGGELAVTTGLNLERQRQNQGLEGDALLYGFLKNFIDSFIDHNASGLVINIGKYITSIPQSIIDYCDDLNFPLFTMPWEVHTIDLMQEVGNMISSDSRNSHNLERLLYNAIFKLEDFDPKELENTDFADAQSFSLALLNTTEDLFNNDSEKLKHYVHYSMNPKIPLAPSDYCCFIQNHKIIYVIKNDAESFARELEKVIKNDKNFKDSKIALSNSSSNPEDLSELYRHAQVTMDMAENQTLNRFQDLGFFKLLVDIKNPLLLQDLYQEIFGKLDVLDQDKKADYLKTLSLYLKYSGNMKQVADKNFIHRNTAIYRIKRIEEILGIDLADGESRFRVHTGLYIRDLLNYA